MAWATSSAVTSRPSGCRAASAARSAAGSGAAASSRATHGVSTVAGATQFTLIPSPMWSAAIARVSDSTAPLVAEYSARRGNPAVATIEQVFTIIAWPRRADGARCADPRVVDQDVKATEHRYGLRDRRPNRRVIGHICLDCVHPDSSGPGARDIAVKHRDPRPARGEKARGGEADPRRAPRDQGAASAELSLLRARVAGHAVTCGVVGHAVTSHLVGHAVTGHLAVTCRLTPHQSRCHL